MKNTILRNLILVTLIGVLISSVVSVVAVHSMHLASTGRELRSDAQFILQLLGENPNLEQLQNTEALLEAGTRVTLVAPDGTVLYDNRADAALMENHLSRREIQGALLQGEAEGRRLSRTLGSNTFYYAVLLPSGQVIRFAKDTDSFLYTLYRMFTLILLVAAGVLITAAFVGERLAESMVTPINNLDLDRPLDNEVYPELAPLLLKLHRQNQRIAHQVEALKGQQEQLQAIATNMTEGLLLVDSKANIVYLNPSAAQLLGLAPASEGQYLGRSLWQFNRDLGLRQGVGRGLRGEHTEVLLTVGKERYQLLISPFSGEGGERGVVLIAVNITKKFELEQLRREFTANVSHELKTPLTAISSLAELLKNGLVRSADVAGFAERIYDEAQRMIRLVQDLLRLSQLDEGAEIRPKSPVDLFQIAREVAERLQPLAAEQGVALEVQGSSGLVQGDPGILFELIYNLCDNSIKYNRPGGQVLVSCVRSEDKVVLKVADTGIGIPKAHHSRIFERFYRVDKSHSRKTGGTGLGLSIVKHAAAYHQASLTLESEENVGTTITLTFPAL